MWYWLFKYVFMGPLLTVVRAMVSDIEATPGRRPPPPDEPPPDGPPTSGPSRYQHIPVTVEE